MPQPFVTTRLVEFCDTDMAGIVHFAAFFRYMESAEHALLRHVGLRVHSNADGQVLSFPRVAASCDYTSPLHCEEMLEIAVSVARIGGKSLTYRFEMSVAGRPVATGSMTSVCCRMVPGEPPRSMELPDRVVAALEPYRIAE